MKKENNKFRNYTLALFVLLISLLTGCILQNQNDNSGGGGSSTSSNNNQQKKGYIGQIIKTPDGSQYDDYLKTETDEYGIESPVEEIQLKLIELRDTGEEVIIFGELVNNVPDYGGQQILVNQIKVPSEDLSFTWFVENNKELGISFYYPEHTVFEIIGNSINFDGWALEPFKNPKSLEFQQWLDLNFAESKSAPCQLDTVVEDLVIGDYETYKISIGEEENCEELGIFAMSIDKQNVARLLIGEFPNQNYKRIIKTFRFVKTLTKDEVDINQAKKSGEDNGNDSAGLANPASVFCEEQNGKIDIRIDEKNNGEYGVCIFKDGTECEEWAFYRGECKIGDSK